MSTKTKGETAVAMTGDDKSAKERTVKVVWDDSKMQMSYANVCNVSSTREEFNLLFGTNQSWTASQQSVRIALSNRIILNPHAAKRLARLLSTAVEQYEEKMGEIAVETGTPQPSIDESQKH